MPPSLLQNEGQLVAISNARVALHSADVVEAAIRGRGRSQKTRNFRSDFAQLRPSNSSRPISILLISLVPAPIAYNFASRRMRPAGYSLM